MLFRPGLPALPHVFCRRTPHHTLPGALRVEPEGAHLFFSLPAPTGGLYAPTTFRISRFSHVPLPSCFSLGGTLLVRRQLDCLLHGAPLWPPCSDTGFLVLVLARSVPCCVSVCGPRAGSSRSTYRMYTACNAAAFRIASGFGRNCHSPSTNGDDPLIVASVEECGYACYTRYV